MEETLTRTSERRGEFRDAPWNQRRAHTGHHRHLSRLLLVHELTLAWIGELKLERKPYSLERGLAPEVAETLPLLDRLEGNTETRMEALLDDTSPDDVLGRLDHTIWATHALSWSAIRSKTPAASLAALTATLQQAAWRLGRKTAEELWPEDQLHAMGDNGSPDLRKITAAAADTPIAGSTNGITWIIERSLRDEVRMALRTCPHHSPYVEVSPEADALCDFQFHWIRGFAYGLNPRAILSREEPREGRCRLRWSLLMNPTL